MKKLIFFAIIVSTFSACKKDKKENKSVDEKPLVIKKTKIKLPDALLEKILAAGAQTIGQGEGLQARILVSCSFNKEFKCQHRKGYLNSELRDEFVKSVGENLIKSKRYGIIVTCGKKLDNWDCSYMDNGPPNKD